LVVGYLMGDECVFCKIVQGKIGSEKVLDNENFVVIKDAYPALEGHLLVVPKKHYDNFLDMPSEIYKELLVAVKEVVGKMGVENFNLVVNNGSVAGQVVHHFHLHILPRREGDGFKIGT
jgi:histidine triad (HIT) family protein